MDMINSYFSRALDFVGEEKKEDYKKICIVAFVGRILLDILFRVFCLIFASSKFIIVMMMLGIGPVVAIIWMLPLFAATIRRCKYWGKSKLWAGAVLFAIGPIILWFLLRSDSCRSI
ncbi:MAG: hypothetical protein QM657_15585 [Lacrimispora sp.]|uniref:hypothetical protein n=1 Tax=Lacrimispora sp. TaxID=2719234 RepID=UPI0039E2C18E